MGNKVGRLCNPNVKHEIKLKKPEATSTTVPSLTGSQENFLEADAAHTVPETGHSSVLTNNIPQFICEICIESKPLKDSFNVEGCVHFYCTPCIINYIVSKLQDNVLHIRCPESGCAGVLELCYCKPILPNNVLVLWEKAMCESVIPSKAKFYCPYKDCSALLINEIHKGQVITESSCPHCKRSFCVQCKAPWHPELTCAKFQSMKNSNDDLMVDLANRRKWRSCPNCKQYIEKKDGCDFIVCRCGHSFCYECGASYSNTYHTCPACHK